MQQLLQKKILIVDDNQLFCESVCDDLSGESLQVITTYRIAEARSLCQQTKFDVVLLDNHLPDGSGISLVPDILKFNDRAKIIFITAFPTWNSAVTALKTGAYDYLSKPVDMEELRVVVERALRASELEQLEQVQSYERTRESEESILIGEGTAFDNLQELIRKAASTNVSVLITGDTGTGKNVVAKAIHYAGITKTRPFISVNCAALPENLIEAELFGVERGAYTGAVTTRKGTFELADGGTLFLDEIGEMPYPLQAKLLSALEDRKVKRVGGDVVRSVNVRIIAATNLDPEQAIREHRFRRDLYYRLGVIHIHLIPLRERRQDINYLVGFFIRKFAPGRNVRLPDTEMEPLTQYDWPGNVRELKNVIERSLILQEGPFLYPSKLLTPPAGSMTRNLAPHSNDEEPIIFLEEIERQYILKTLNKLDNNYSRTAKALGISLSTLKRKLQIYDS
jgi:DNA-binding NtrC family response regulator